MNDEDLCFTPATELIRLIRRKNLSPVELMQAVLARMEAVNPLINAFCTPTAEQALEKAKQAEAAAMKGDWWGSLHGIPFSVKDLMDTKGVRTMYGSYSKEHYVPDHSTPAVERMEAAGAISVGKTTTPEYGWKALTDCPLTGVTHNPWHLEHNPGGSSGGAAAAVAAGIAPLALGSDGGGSIRVPASFSGIFGHKPSYGRVPYAGANPHNHAHEGPMTRTVADAALMQGIIAGPDDRDQFSLEKQPDDYLGNLKAGIQGMRVGWSVDLGFVKKLDPEVAEQCQRAADAFVDLGCSLDEAALDLTGIMALAISNWKAAMAMRVYNLIPEHTARMDEGLKACALEGKDLPARDYLEGKFKQYEYYLAVVDYFERFDLLLTPTVACLPLKNGTLLPDDYDPHPWNWLDWAPYSSPFNMLGNPSATVPVGFSKSGLPIGLQITGPRHMDLRVLQAAHAFEQANPWAQTRPALKTA